LRTAEDGSKYYLLRRIIRSRRIGGKIQDAAKGDGLAIGKSTYARAGLLVNATPLEAGWEGASG
jgi:dCTP deaminase